MDGIGGVEGDVPDAGGGAEILAVLSELAGELGEDLGAGAGEVVVLVPGGQGGAAAGDAG